MSHDARQEENKLHQIDGHLLPLAQVYTLLDQLATNELESEETEMLRRHLAECQTCSQMYLEIGQYHHLLRGVMSNEAPAPVIDQVPQDNHMLPLRQPPAPAPLPAQPRQVPGPFRRTSIRLLIAAVVVVVIVADLLIFRNVLPQTQHTTSAHSTPTTTKAATATAAATPTEGLAPDSPWRKLWTLPPLPPPPQVASPYQPQIVWSPANAQRLYLCQASLNYELALRSVGNDYNTTLPTVLHNLYRSDDQGRHWTAYPLPEATAECYLEVDPTNADALVLLDGQYHPYFSRDGGQTWQPVPGPPHWTPNQPFRVFPAVQIMAGRLYVEGYWTDDLTHWTRWYPVADEQEHVFAQINPQQPQTLYTAVDPKEFRCAGMPATLQLGAEPAFYQAQLCRSDNGGQTWRFLAVVVAQDHQTAAFCLALNHPETLYAVGYTAQSYPNPYRGGVTGDPLRSTDGGSTWTRLPGVFVGGTTGVEDFPSCASNASAGQSPVTVDADDPIVDDNQWRSFGVTADGTFYHVVDTTGTRQGVTMMKGISMLTGTGWKVIAPYPDGVTTPPTNFRLKVLLITPPSGAPVLLAFTDQHIYEYPLLGG